MSPDKFPLSRRDMQDIKAMVPPKNPARFNLLCVLRIHKWKPWKVLATGKIALPDGMPIGMFRELQRKCVNCGLREARRISWTGRD